jgi:hypothetical protein
MASQWPPKKNTAFTLYFTLYKNDGTVVANPGTITKKVSIDGGAVANIAASVTEEDTTYGQCSLVLANTEMNGDAIWVYITDNTTGTVPFTCTLYTAGNTQDEVKSAIDTIDGIVDDILVDTGTTLDTLIKDIPTVSEFEARTIAAADYTIVSDLGTVQTGDAYAIVNSGTYGNSALKTLIDTVDNFIDTEVAAILADTNELQTDWANGGRLDLLIDAIKAKTDSLTFTVAGDVDCNVQSWKGSAAADMTGDAYARLGAPAGASVSADVAAVKAQTAAIEADTQDLQTQIGTDGAGLTNIPWNAAWDAEVQSECTDALNAYDPPTKTEMDSAFTTTNGKIDTIDDFLDTEIAAILADTNELQTDWANGGRLDLILDAASAPTAADVADAVWDEALSGHAGAGSAGAALSAAGAVGDPWLTTLPGSYGAGTAGKIVGDNINAPIATVDTVVDGLATELAKVPKSDSTVTWNATALASIQTECTDALNAYDPPTKTEMDSAFSTTNGKIDAVDDYVDTEVAAVLAAVDTEVAAIKAKTDNLPASPAAVGSPMTLTSDYDAAKTASSQTSVNTVDGIVDDIIVDTGTTIPATLTTIEGKIDAIAPGAGAIEWTYTVATSGGVPISGVSVWCTSDVAGTVVLQSGTTNASGVVTFWLAAGTVYVWCYKEGYNFTNPDVETVS